ncbi:MAG: SMODS domain-containing nucleotidyltransferase [Pseudomonadota bacterium]|jgi:hypothetical protein
MARNIEPTASQKKAASASHQYLRGLMDTGGIGNRILSSYLSGSYARGTAVKPLDDVDIIFLIEESKWATGFLSMRPKPSVVLRSFADAVRYRYDKSSAFTQRRSIRLELSHIDIDCVPAIEIPGSDHIWVGDRKDDAWIKSSPKLHHAKLTKANQLCDGWAVPAIKLLKAWNKSLPSTAQVRSFVIETIAVTALTAAPRKTLLDCILEFFDFVVRFRSDFLQIGKERLGITISGLFGMAVPDLARTGGNVASGVGGGQATNFMDRAIRTRELLEDGQHARTEDSAAKHVFAALGRA